MPNQEMTASDPSAQDIRAIAANIAEQARRDVGARSMLKFKKGDYFLDGEPVPLGTTYLVYCQEWTKVWVHFEDKVPVEKRIYKPALQQLAPERDQIPDNDQTKWERFGPEQKPKDPWVLQYLVPFEDIQSGKVSLFVGQSYGAYRAVGMLCNEWADRVRRMGDPGNPIIELRTGFFRSKNWGQVVCPLFHPVRWVESEQVGSTNGGVSLPPRVEVEALALKDDMNDEIPF